MGGRSSKVRKLKKKEMKELAQTTHFSAEELLALYEHFKYISASKDNDGVIDLEEWLQALELRDSTFSRRIFQAFDEDANGTISFREFVLGLSVFSPRSTIEEKLDLSFRIYDIDGDGHIDKEELFQILKASLLENYMMDLSDDQMRELVDNTFAETDVNGDGLISFEEYRDMVISHPEILSKFSLNSDLLLQSTPGQESTTT
ncbi:calcineurin B [Thecamonas trahens ATCC 50062]|uniref:Calcineurin B n=1 Tax=Thecamonas trahens ATCC 50062 TaxID=461836 RepID=A0A0L0D451_THETB|nr:calcineurin B [Thecamonas trahens ATCC 50062]KNC47035.1 calcineurin B [Thecamonas trahens ATCC 50062]|eukprot:XP_013759815.1 calcineurin B [Thecamonas trahens ATCC 50062]